MRRMLVVALLSVGSAARADCPTTPEDPVCRPWSALLLPTMYGGIYAPREGTMFFGVGVEAVLFAWSDNSEAFGPSQGRIRADVGLYAPNKGAGNLVMYRTGAQVGFERNASRAYGIPFFAMDFGGLWSDATGRRWFVDTGLGMYLVHRRSLILDAEITAVLPFQQPAKLGGLTSRIALSFALW